MSEKKISVRQALSQLEEYKHHHDELTEVLLLVKENFLEDHALMARAMLHAGLIDLDNKIKSLEGRIDRSWLSE